MESKKTTRKTTTRKKTTKKAPTKKATTQPAKATQQDNGTWKGAFFVLLFIVVILLVYMAVGGNGDGSGRTTVPTNNNNGPVGDGVVVIEEYSDFECPFCARALPAVNQIKETYGDNVRFEYKHFPLSIHPNAPKAGEASECARDQGKFWEYHDVLFENQQRLTVTYLKQYAADLGLDTATFNSCLDSGEKAAIVQADFDEGRAKGVSGTPTFFVNGEKLVGAQPFSAFQPIIDAALSQGADTVAPTAPVPATDDPEVELIVVEDSSCETCSTQQVIDAIETELVPSAVIRRVEFDTAEGQRLIEELSLVALPSFIFGEELKQTSNYARLQQTIQQQGEYLVVNSGAVGTVKLLEMPGVENNAFKGDANAPVTIIEYSDFECPFCARFYDDAYQQILNTYVASGDVKIVYKHFPLSFHPNAQKAAEASECAEDQGKFWEYHDTLFENQQSLTLSDLKQYAADLGLDTAAFDSCLDSGEKAAIVQAELEEGQRYGISGTPGFIVNGIPISGAQPFNAFETIIEAELGN